MACNDPKITELLHQFSPSGTVLLDWLKPRVDDSMLRDIAYADYGLNEEEYFHALILIRDEQKIPAPLHWCPREALELTRWSEPDIPEEKPVYVGPDGRMGSGGLIWRPQAKGERGHWIRLFSCAVLLKAADDVETQDQNIIAENDTLIQFVSSAAWLGPEASENALRFLCWRMLRISAEDKIAGDEYPFFAMAILLLCVCLFQSNEDSNDLKLLADWVIAEEARRRGFDTWDQDSEEWLLGLTNFDQRHDAWRKVTWNVLRDPTKTIPEPALSTLKWISDRIAPDDAGRAP